MNQELSLEDKLMEEGFTSFGDIDNLTEEDFISNDDIFEYIFSITDDLPREKIIAKLQLKAKSLKISKQFNSLLKAYKEKFFKGSRVDSGNKTNFSNCKYPQMNCGAWTADDNGVYMVEVGNNMQKNIIRASYIPVLPVKRLINIDDDVEKVEIAMHKDKKWKTIIVDRNSIASKSKILNLANKGLEVTEDNAKHLIKYLADVLALNEFIPQKAVTHLGWIDEDFVPYTDKYTYDGEDNFKNIYKGISEKGNYDKWLETTKKLRENSQTLKLDMAVSFASPLVEICNINPFILHVWGKSSNGKTVGQMVALSIWGNPTKKHLFSTFSNTIVANERLSNFLKHLPLALDELQLAKNKFKNFDEMIYSLTEGKGKERGNTDGGLQQSTQWNNAILLSGEEPITTPASKEGVKNRVIELNEEGIIVSDGREVVKVISNNYGFAGRIFIEYLKKNMDNVLKRYDEIMELLKNYAKYPKQVNQLAAILVADEIVSQNIFEDEPFTIDEIKEYFTKDTDEADRYVEIIIDEANTNINKFFDEEKETTPKGEVWGEVERDEISKNIVYYNFIPEVLRKILANNADNEIRWDGIKRKLADKNYVARDSQGKYSIVCRTPEGWARRIKIRNIHKDGNLSLDLSNIESFEYDSDILPF